jgi:sulfotransferase
MKQFFFITGIARSGSTLLSTILSQNPDFHADITTDVKVMVDQIQQMDGRFTQKYAFNVKQDIMRSTFEHSYKHIDKPIIFDTNRGWGNQIDLIHTLFPTTKMLVCVRNIVDVLNSFEHLYRNNIHANVGLYGGEYNTVYDRCQSLMYWKGVVGYSLCGVNTAIASASNHIIFLIDYDDLVSDPQFTLSEIYKFLELPQFEHDFINLESDDYTMVDNEIGVKSLHDVRKTVKKINLPMILPQDIVNQYIGCEPWL